MNHRLIVFLSVHTVMKAEKLLQSKDYAIKIIPLPREITSDCGVGIQIAENVCSGAQEALFEAQIDHRVYCMGTSGYTTPCPEEKEPRFDLLSTVEQGGCSAKLPPGRLRELLSALPLVRDERILVHLDTCDDAGVYKLNDDTALIFTTDFFPPVCPDPFDFGQVAAANSLSDVYAMGGTPLLVLNLMMFPTATIPGFVHESILRGGAEKIAEAGAILIGGHTIDDAPPKYGLAVVGTVHPDKVISNTHAKPCDVLLLSKPIGTGILVAGRRMGLIGDAVLRHAVDSMKRLNNAAADTMERHGVKAATDITGFGLLGHALNIARGSEVTLRIDATAPALLPGTKDLIENGCIPGAAFRNRDYLIPHTRYAENVPYWARVTMWDAQTSGGLLMCVPPEQADGALEDLLRSGHQVTRIGDVLSYNGVYLDIVSASIE